MNKILTKRHLSLFLFLLLVGCASEAGLVSHGSERHQSLSQKLNRLFEEYFEEHLRLSPIFATSIGDHRYDDRIGIGISEEHREQQRTLYKNYLGKLAELNPDALEGRDRLSYDLFKYRLTLHLEELQLNQHLLPVRQLFSTPVEFPLLGSGRGVHPFRAVKDYDNFLNRVKDFRLWVDTAIANMRRGVEVGIVQPRVVMERTLPQLEAMIASDTKQSVFYQPILRMPPTFAEAEKARLTQAYAQAVEQQVIPTYRKLHSFIRDEYLPRCRVSVGMYELPGGSHWYAHLVRAHTTTNLTPDEIFQLGLAEVERIMREINKLKQNSGFGGSLREFASFLAENTPSYSTKEDLIKAYEGLITRVTPLLPRLFGRLPKAPYEIRAIEEFRQRSSPSQYRSASPDGTRPAIFYVNAADVSRGPVRRSESLFLPEAMPGHHLQISLQRERADLPGFRRFGGYTAFAEGWALYAEGLGQELGLYTDPYQNFLRLNSERFRAVRLVVDVGLHHKGWTRQQALKYMRENTLASESGALLEIDRYIAWPGQALAYKIAQLKISAMHAKAEKVLGSRFDIRAFHDELLKDGAMPLDLLEAKMDAWIADQLR
ncbi:MAG: DUF885 domain-containing protein [Deltaproteobacteria bacterium]|nr:DUF885 domain-containing protein [Deltaproteobacteria bacterium]